MNVCFRCLIIILLSAPTAGCWKYVTPAVPEASAENVEHTPAPAAITPAEPRSAMEPAEAPAPPQAAAPPEMFVTAERNFAAGDYRRAAQAFETFLQTFPNAPERDHALFHLGFSLALSGDDRYLHQTEIALRRLIVEFPKSPYRRQAEWILDMKSLIERLQSDISERDERILQLSEELRVLKLIDIERRPSRPE